jgi:hypothetical protein
MTKKDKASRASIRFGFGILDFIWHWDFDIGIYSVKL